MNQLLDAVYNQLLDVVYKRIKCQLVDAINGIGHSVE